MFLFWGEQPLKAVCFISKTSSIIKPNQHPKFSLSKSLIPIVNVGRQSYFFPIDFSSDVIKMRPLPWILKKIVSYWPSTIGLDKFLMEISKKSISWFSDECHWMRIPKIVSNWAKCFFRKFEKLICHIVTLEGLGAPWILQAGLRNSIRALHYVMLYWWS